MATTGFDRFKITVGELTGTPSSMSFYFLAPKESYEGLPKFWVKAPSF